MNYDPDDFLALAQAVEDQGGAILSEPCVGRTFPIKLPDERGERVVVRNTTCRCGNTSRISIPYRLDPEVARKRQEQYGLITFCAVCDAAGKMPKFRHVIDHDRSY